MKRETPYPSKRQTPKRITLKKHESIVSIMEQRIKKLEDDLVSKGGRILCYDRENRKLKEEIAKRDKWIAERAINE